MNKRAAVTMALLGMCGVVGLAVGCTDNDLAPAKATSVRGGRSSFSRIRGHAPVTPAEFDQRNPMHWVGVAHNRGVDAIRAQLRAHTLHARNVCRDVPEVVATDAARPIDHRTLPAKQLVEATRRYLASLPICSLGTASTAAAVGGEAMLARPASIVESRLLQSDEETADGLLTGIGTVTQNAADAASLAPELDSITALADNLDSASQSVIYGAAAVAMSSMEYWQDNLEETTYEVDRDYCDTEAPSPDAGPCMEVPYSVVAPAALPAMTQSVDWGILGEIAGADVGVVISGGIAGWILKATVWEATIAAAEGASGVTAVRILYREIKAKFF